MSYSPDVYRRADALDALTDYNAMGPEPFYNAVGGYALTAWIKACREVEEVLTPEQCSSVGWMYAERACCRMSDYLQPDEDQKPLSRDTVADGIKSDLTVAVSFFDRAENETDDPIFAAFARIDRASMPLMRHALVQREEITENEWSALGRAEQTGMVDALKHYQQRKHPADAVRLNVLLARLMVGNLHVVKDHRRVILPGSARHRNGGDTDYDNWQFAVFTGANFHRFQVAPRGRWEREVLIDPDMLNNRFLATPHGRGGAVACVQFFGYRSRLERALQSGRSAPIPNVQDRRADDYYHATVAKLGPHVEERLEEPPLKGAENTDPLAWYNGLSPYADPVHVRYGDALDSVVTSLETAYGQEGLYPDEEYILGQAYVDSVSSPSLQDETSHKVIDQYLKRAETLFFSAANELPREYPKRYEFLIAGASVSARKAILLGAHEGILHYQQQLLMIAEEMLQRYESSPNKKTPETRMIGKYLHEITAYLLPLARQDIKQVVLPALTRQRVRSKKQHFDCTVWRQKESGEFVPGPFAVRFGERADATTVDAQILTLQQRYLGQWKPGDNFLTLRALLGGKYLNAVQKEKAARAYKDASSFMNTFLQQATERKPI